MAAAYEQEHAFKEAAEAYEKILKLNPKHLPAMVRLATLYGGPLRDVAKALEIAAPSGEQPEALGP